jgi:hypothetical protein
MEARQCVIDGVLTRIHTMNLPDLVDRPDLIDGLHTSGGQGVAGSNPVARQWIRAGQRADPGFSDRPSRLSWTTRSRV